MSKFCLKIKYKQAGTNKVTSQVLLYDTLHDMNVDLADFKLLSDVLSCHTYMLQEFDSITGEIYESFGSVKSLISVNQFRDLVENKTKEGLYQS